MFAYLALGSNLGDREAYLRAGLYGLARQGVEIVRCASIYATEPKDVPDQPWFLNTVALGNTNLEPKLLLQACLAVEAEQNRRRDTAKGPRTLDIDIILYDSRIVRETGLTIPHPRFSSRRFVLDPLAEIAPGFIDPLSGKTIRVLLAECPDDAEVQRVGSFQDFP